MATQTKNHLKPTFSLSRFHTFSLSHFHTRKGFTLIEMVIVILLIGVLGALFVPRFLQQHDSFKVEAAAEQIANHIRLAQSLAIARHQTHGVGFAVTPDNFYSVYSVYDQVGYAVADPLKGGSYSLWGIDFDTHEQLKGVTIESPTTLTGDQVDFNALGKPTAGGGRVTITKGSSTLRIGVATETGAVSIW